MANAAMNSAVVYGAASAPPGSSLVMTGSAFKWKKPGSLITRGKSQTARSPPNRSASAF
jgi:hypothetical protein